MSEKNKQNFCFSREISTKRRKSHLPTAFLAKTGKREKEHLVNFLKIEFVRKMNFGRLGSAFGAFCGKDFA